MKISNKQLIEKAKEKINPIQISKNLLTSTGYVSCALLTKKGNTYVGVNLDFFCGIGFCSEHNAIGSMITNNEFDIKKIVAINYKNKIFPPCGRCRELMTQISKYNYNNTEVIISSNKSVKLKELLPHYWKNHFK
jgi:cytidine deaminase